MSRSKEGLDKEKNATVSRQGETPSRADYLDQQLGAKGQTDYTSGRESWREYPRRSTSLKGRSDSRLEQSNLYDSPLQGDQSIRSRDDRRSRTARLDRTSNEASDYSYDRTRSAYGRSNRFDRDDRTESGNYGGYSQYDQHSYRDLQYGRADHEDLPRTQGRYRANERNYDYGRDNYRAERREYDEPYNREALGGQYDYDRSFERYGYRPASDLRNEGRGRDANYLRCNDIMTKNVTVCSAQTALREVAEKMQDDGIGSIPVVDGGRLVGIVTDRDIVCRVIAEGRDTRTTLASEAMSDDVVTCGPDDSVHEAIRKMGEHQIRRIPVCDNTGRLRGIIAMADIALEAERDRELACALEQISQPTPNRSRKR